MEMDCGKEGGIILLRKAEGIQDWFQQISACWKECNGRGMETTKQFWSKQTWSDSDLEQWLLARQRIGECVLQITVTGPYLALALYLGQKYHYTTSTPSLHKTVPEPTNHNTTTVERKRSRRRRRPRSESK